jgi:hypothetical protein
MSDIPDAPKAVHEVQLVFVSANRKAECEAELAGLLDAGWKITAAGGGGSSGTTNGFVVLVREVHPAINNVETSLDDLL